MALNGLYERQKQVIDHTWYLVIGLQNIINTDKYNDCIPFIQQMLVKEFNIEENLKNKISRKAFTKFIIS